MSGETVHARLPAEVVARLDERADAELRSRSNLVAFLVAKGLAEAEDAAAWSWWLGQQERRAEWLGQKER